MRGKLIVTLGVSLAVVVGGSGYVYGFATTGGAGLTRALLGIGTLRVRLDVSRYLRLVEAAGEAGAEIVPEPGMLWEDGGADNASPVFAVCPDPSANAALEPGQPGAPRRRGSGRARFWPRK